MSAWGPTPPSWSTSAAAASRITHGGASARLARSFKLGVIRLAETFVRSDPIARRDERRLVRHINQTIAPYVDDIVARGFARVIGTSGTILSLGALAAMDTDPLSSDELRNRRVGVKHIRRVREQLVALPIERRLEIRGLDPRRADLAVGGSILLDTILRRLRTKDLTLCDLALREGLVLDYIRTNRARIAKVGRYPDVRRRSVIELAERCNYSPRHARQVAKLALSMFDQTRPVHGLIDRDRELLEYAALLHDIGVHVGFERHHRHSYYLIKNGGLRGFEPQETEILALVARYHRRARPKKSHQGYGTLGPRTRRTVRVLSALLRLAEGLDRSHAQTVQGVLLRDHGESYQLRIRSRRDTELELWAANRHAAPLQKILGKPLRLEARGTIHAQHADRTSRVSRQAVRRRRHRRLGQDDAAGPPRQVDDRGRTARVRDRVELVGAGEGRDTGRQEEEPADTNDLQSAARDRLR